MTIEGPDTGVTQRLKPGDADGFFVKYNSTTAAMVTAGNIEANRKKYSLSSDASHIMTSLTVGADFHYLYIDDDASSPPTPTIIDSTTEPSLDDAKRGLYNSDDRCIGVVFSPPGGATVFRFEMVALSNRHIRIEFPGFRNTSAAPWNSPFELASLMNPTGVWQTPNIAESDTLTPVNAVEAYIFLTGTDVGGAVNIAWLNNESAALNPTLHASPNFRVSREFHQAASWGPLGASRKIKIGETDDDDNLLGALMAGYGYVR